MAVITPTITTDDAHEYRDQLQLIESFAEGVHIDFADGNFAPTKLLPIAEAWRSDKLVTHIHVMHKKPLSVVDDIVAFGADLVVLHVESEGVKECLLQLNELGVRTGVALLPETPLERVSQLEIDKLFDHILVFAGHLGYQGGEADPTQMDKVRLITETYPDVEIGWDGGVSTDNSQIIAGAGVHVLNTGGAIKHAKDPKKAYEQLATLIS